MAPLARRTVLALLFALGVMGSLGCSFIARAPVGDLLVTRVSLIQNSDLRLDYDLRQKPLDICLRVAGNPYMGMGVGIESPWANIPAAAIARLFASPR